MAELEPVHLMRWIEENHGAFAPPVANKEVFPESEFIYQIVRGPNARNDFHIDPGDEIFYQLAGDITVRCREATGRSATSGARGRGHARARRHAALPDPSGRHLGAGHRAQAPGRRAGRAGLVLRALRRQLHEERFACADIERELKVIIERFNANAALRTCKPCGAVLPVPGGAVGRGGSGLPGRDASFRAMRPRAGRA